MPRDSRIARALLAGCVVLIAIGIAWRSDFFVGSAFTAARWPLVGVAAILGLRFLRTGRSRAWILAFAVAAAGTGEWVVVRMGRAEAGLGAGEGRLEVVSYNLLFRGGKPAKTLKSLKALEADVIALQEVTSSWETRLRASLSAEYPHQAYRPHHGTHGFALLSRHPIEDVTYVMKSRDLTMAQCAEILASEPVYLCNVHLSSPAGAIWKRSLPRVSKNADDRSKEWTRLAAFVTKHATSERRMLAGDFNTLAVDPLYRRITRDWVDAFQFAGTGIGNTWPNLHEDTPIPLFRIDYVFVQGAVRPDEVAVLPNGGSDHLPLRAKFRL